MVQRLKDDLRAAMKRRDEVVVRVLRMLLADLHNREIAAKAELTDEQVTAALRTAVKQRRDAAEQFAAGGRQDKADEIEIISAYLPELLEGDELIAAIDAAISACGASSPADMGKVMGHLMGEHQGRIDGKEASALVRQRLASS